MLVDSHTHLTFPHFKKDLPQVLQRARQAGVTVMLNAGTDVESSRAVVALAASQAGLLAAVGIHPHCAAQAPPSARRVLADLARYEKVVAIGETGLDFYRSLAPPDVQENLFREQVQLAAELDKPLIVHSREAFEKTLAVLKSEQLPSRKGVMHCFSGDRRWAALFLELGFYISLAGPVTYPRSFELREVARIIPADRLLVETDAPYLPPQPFRRLRNEPAFIKATYDRLALELETDTATLAKQVAENAARLFGPISGQAD